MSAGRIFLGLSLAAALFVAGFGSGRWYGTQPKSTARREDPKPAGFHCPMHPHVRSDRPSDCPICGMKLVPDEAPSAPAPAPPSTTTATASTPPDAIHVSPEKQQLIGVKYGVAEMSSSVQTFRTTGRVMMDETKIAKVQSRISGWVEKVYADFTGKAVQKGDPLLTVYSPELLASQQEYLLALRSREILRNSPIESSRNQSESLIAASRRRLELFDLSTEQIDEIARTGKPVTNVTLYAPVSGYVMTRNAFPKQRIMPETELFVIADLSRVWIQADVFEGEAPEMRIGMPVTLSLPYSGGKTRPGRVAFIQPQVDNVSRTLKVRVEADNPNLQLRPDMYVDVEFRVGQGNRLTVPSEAVLDTGLRKTVFVDLGEGFLQARQVETGERSGDRVQILKGLRAGERVVTSGNFLIDSESQLRSPGPSTSGSVAAPPSASTPPAAHQHD